jgi:nitroreductase
MNTFLNSLNWRFATKKFDTNKKVCTEDIQKIKDSIRLSPSSFGIQPFRVVVIEDQKLKQQSFSFSS